MTSLPVVAQHDAAVLAAKASRGAVVLAEKDLAAGRVMAGSDVGFQVAGFSVTLDPNRLELAVCSCPAVGLCRHIIAAVLFARQMTGEGADIPAETASPAPAEVGFDVAAVQSFAKSDWSRARDLAPTAQIETASHGGQIVRFVDRREAVIFHSAQPLEMAEYSGPRASAKRMAIAAAALAVLAANGVAIPQAVAEDDGPERRADPRVLAVAIAALERVSVAIALGQKALAADQIFGLSLSARVEAMPRLAAELRGLARALDAPGNRPDQSTVAHLQTVAKVHALATALTSKPDDPILLGIGARRFAPRGPRQLAYLGAETWRSATGARGFTMYFMDPASGQVLRATEARASDADLTWSAKGAWGNTFFQSLSPISSLGQVFAFPDILLSVDGAISLNQSAIRDASAPSAGDLAHAVSDWASLWVNYAAQRGYGLYRRAFDPVFVIEPKAILPPVFDLTAQRWRWSWIDASGRALNVVLSDEAMRDHHIARKGDPQKSSVEKWHEAQPDAALVRVSQNGDATILSLWVKGAPRPLAPSVERPTDPKPAAPKWRDKISAFLGEGAKKVAPQQDRPIDRIALYFERALEAVVLRMGQMPAPDAPRSIAAWPEWMIRETEALHLSIIAQALHATEQQMTASNALELIYLLSLGVEALETRRLVAGPVP